MFDARTRCRHNHHNPFDFLNRESNCDGCIPYILRFSVSFAGRRSTEKISHQKIERKRKKKMKAHNFIFVRFGVARDCSNGWERFLWFQNKKMPFRSGISLATTESNCIKRINDGGTRCDSMHTGWSSRRRCPHTPSGNKINRIACWNWKSFKLWRYPEALQFHPFSKQFLLK